MIVLVSGFKRSGKDTIADYLVNTYSFIRYGFADPIRETLKSLFDWNDYWINNYKETIDDRWGISYRQAAQWFGTDMFQHNICNTFPLFKETIGRNFWVKKFEELYLKDPSKNYVLSDYRFPHEYNLLKGHSPYCIRVIRNGCCSDGHESEALIDSLYADTIIENNSSIQDLYAAIDKCYTNIVKFQ